MSVPRFIPNFSQNSLTKADGSVLSDRKQVITSSTGSISSVMYYLNGADGKTEAVNWNGSTSNYTYNIWGDENIGQIRITGAYQTGQPGPPVFVVSWNRYYYLKDHLGTVRMTVDAAANVVSYDDYYPYGMQMPTRSLASSNEDARYKFTSKERDVETNYDYFGARYYDNRIGRWLQPDPMATKYPRWSPYNYCLDIPMIIFDPNGMIVRGANADMKKKLEEAIKNNPALKAQYDQLNNSDEIYYITYGEVTDKEAEGDFGYDGEKFVITLTEDGTQSFEARLAHEFAHGQEYENGEIGFYSTDKGKKWKSFNYDMTDEVKAYDAALKAATVNDYWDLNHGTRSVLGDYAKLTDMKEKISFLRNHGYGYDYEGRPDGPLNNILMPDNAAGQIKPATDCGKYLSKFKLWSEQ
jgi:RHS repeat-associated protein